MATRLMMTAGTRLGIESGNSSKNIQVIMPESIDVMAPILVARFQYKAAHIGTKSETSVKTDASPTS